MAFQITIETMQAAETAVAKHSDTIIGFITTHIHFPKSAKIHVMGILPAYHRQGIGKTLFCLGANLHQVKTAS